METDRLSLRQWRPEDREPFAAMNADPVDMCYLPARGDPAEDFDHPGVDPAWPGRCHVLYRLASPVRP